MKLYVGEFDQELSGHISFHLGWTVLSTAFFENPHVFLWGHAVTYLIEALCYKPEGRGFESR
jgi:hypothetical protein